MSEVDYISMLNALERGASVGDLATEIERSGVWGWDRYGRFRRFPAEDAESLKALERLALHYEKLNDPQDHEYGGVDWDPQTDRLVLYGWPAGEAPNFDEPQVVVRNAPRRQAVAREENANLRLIDALRRLCLGELTESRHPDCADEAALIAAIENHFIGREGLKKATIKAKFKAAADLWEIA